MQITLIGHSTILIETAGKRILTDPFWNTWGNPAFARVGTPAKTREEMADVDAVLVSHDHWDHVDAKYFKMCGSTPIFAPFPASAMIKLMGGKTVSNINTGTTFAVGEVKITVVPAVHLTHSVGYILQSEGKIIYFAGDTFYNGFMLKLGEDYQIDAALMPVTTFRIPMTMNEAGALKAARTLYPSVILPIHLGLNPRSPLMRTGDSADHFARLVEAEKLPVRVVQLQNGETFSM
jgi:L-ascorbate metabolism protein UlaG (beta-lactamase superfamily)